MFPYGGDSSNGRVPLHCGGYGFEAHSLFFNFYFWMLNIMEDIMLIRSSFLRRIISQVINKMLKKQLPGTEVQLGEVQANWSEKEQKLKIHLVVDAEMTKPQLMDILKKADVI